MNTHLDFKAPRIEREPRLFARDLEDRADNRAAYELSGLRCVTNSSTKRDRKAAYDLGRAFKRELGFDFPPWADNPEYKEEPPRAYLWTTSNYLPEVIAFGGCGFSWVAWKSHASAWSLE